MVSDLAGERRLRSWPARLKAIGPRLCPTVDHDRSFEAQRKSYSLLGDLADGQEWSSPTCLRPAEAHQGIEPWTVEGCSQAHDASQQARLGVLHSQAGPKPADEHEQAGFNADQEAYQQEVTRQVS
jgi:hypothetical protein